MHVIFHIVVWLLCHKVVQSYDMWLYMFMISPCCTCSGGVGLFAPNKLPYCAWKKGQFFCRFALRWWCEVIVKRLCEPNSILPQPVTRNTNRPGIGSNWGIWA
jgi:hypothetical protein